MKVAYQKTVLVLLVAALVSVGMLMIFSTSTVPAREYYRDSYFLLKKQMLWIVVGLVFFWGGARLDYHFYRNKSRGLLLVGAVLLVAVLIPGIGREGGGAHRWLRIGGIGFQPSELVKYFLVIYLADLLARRQGNLESLSGGFLPPIVVIGLFSGLVILQPDLGTALSFVGVGLILLFAGGARLFHLSILILGLLPALAVLIFRVGYRKQRILAFLNPGRDPQGAGFQIRQSLIALGSGGVLGLGLGESRQKLFYLPAAHTDFIFSILGEELGFLGAALVVLLFVGLLVTGFLISQRAEDLFGRLLALGITVMISLQAFVNIGVTCGILPTKGLPLPFVSYGGSNLVASFFAVGILFNIASRRGEKSPSPRRNFPGHFTNLRAYGRKRIS